LGYDAGSGASACSNPTTTFYSTCSNLLSGCTLKLSGGVLNAPDGYYSNGTDVYYVEGNGYINTVSACSVPPPPPPPPPPITWTAVQLSFGTDGAGGTACSNAQNNLTSTYYVDASTFATAAYIRLNNDGSGIPQNRNYSDGIVVRASTGGSLGGSTTCDQL
jgi:hypothetical protein